jgi:hypothetical protein
VLNVEKINNTSNKNFIQNTSVTTLSTEGVGEIFDTSISSRIFEFITYYFQKFMDLLFVVTKNFYVFLIGN